MYAVIETGGKQYRVELGTEIAVERLDAEAGDTIQIDRVLLVADGDEPAIGRPHVDGALVAADVVRQDRGDKIVVFKYRPKARHRAKKGHRQDLTILRIADIRLGDRSAAAVAREEEARRRDAQAAAAEDAARRAAEDQALADRLAREADSESPTDAGAGVADAPKRRPGRSTKSTDASTTGTSAAGPSAGEGRASRRPAARTQAGDAAGGKADTPVRTRKTPNKKDDR